jgi:hypothetical protein
LAYLEYVEYLFQHIQIISLSNNITFQSIKNLGSSFDVLVSKEKYISFDEEGMKKFNII